MKTRKSLKASDPLRPYSSIVLDGPERAAARAMLYPVGFKPADFHKPLIGIASTWGQVTPCNMHIDKLALEAEAGANDSGGKAIIFNTITISDGISMGSEGMKYSLVSREVIADSIETVVGCAGMDGFVAIGGVPSMGEESLMGKEVNFVFRMEKLAGSLGIAVLTSAAGQAKLAAALSMIMWAGLIVCGRLIAFDASFDQ